MSGVEIAGIVLGAVPLIISAMEHYESNLDRTLAFFKWRDELEKALRELWIQHSYYELTLRNLLMPLTTEAELEAMMASPDHDLWSSEELADDLKRRLGYAYKIYIYTLQEIEGHMSTLARHLDIDRQNDKASDIEAIIAANRPIVIPGQNHSRPKFEFRRQINFTMKRKGVKRLLIDLKGCNERLEKFIDKTERYEEPVTYKSKPNSWKSKICIPLEQIQAYSISLHNALSSAWTCSSHAPHYANLLLEHRMIRPRKKSGSRQLRSKEVLEQEEGQANFKLSFKVPCAPATWYGTEVKVVEEEEQGVRHHDSGNYTPKVVNFSLASSSSPMRSTESVPLKVIQDLCSTFQQKNIATWGFCLDVKDTMLRGTYETQKAQCPPTPTGDGIVSLEEMILSSPNSKRWQPITEEERLILAVTLASSFIQLHNTPWLGEKWRKSDVIFYESSSPSPSRLGPSKTSQTVNVRYPFLMKDYQPTPPPPKQSSTTTASPAPPSSTIYSPESTTSPTHDDSINLLTLATMLLEIRFGGGVQARYSTADLGPGHVANEVTDLQTLKAWMRQERGNLSFAWNDAVSYCMKQFANPDADLLDLAYRQTVLENVVVPLLEELHHWQQGSGSGSGYC